MSDEVIQPPRGYCIGVFGTRNDGMIGPFATEGEARQALASAIICAVGAPTGWHNWCGARGGAFDGLYCIKPQGHSDGWHDNGSVAWPET